MGSDVDVVLLAAGAPVWVTPDAGAPEWVALVLELADVCEGAAELFCGGGTDAVFNEPVLDWSFSAEPVFWVLIELAGEGRLSALATKLKDTFK